MAKENIDALMQAAEKDPALADTLRKAGGLDGVVRIGAERGHVFTSAELQAYFEALPANELGDEELAAVAGGAKALSSDGSSSTYLKIELRNVYISSYQLG
jgi:predicted ribosomally synthesized peptide with nif11-like leader